MTTEGQEGGVGRDALTAEALWETRARWWDDDFSRLVAEAINFSEIPRGGQDLASAGQKASRFGLIGLGEQRHLSVWRQPIDAARAVGRKHDLAVGREHIVYILFLGAPERLNGVVGIDPVQRRLLDSAQIEYRTELRLRLRGCSLRLLVGGGILRLRWFYVGACL